MVELWAKQENTNICFFYQYYAFCPLAIRMRMIQRSLTGTVWIHQFDREENVDDGSAAALYFGKETVEYYALDNNLKVL